MSRNAVSVSLLIIALAGIVFVFVGRPDPSEIQEVRSGHDWVELEGEGAGLTTDAPPVEVRTQFVPSMNADGLAVSVRSSSGEPISGASICMANESTCLSRAVTDARGVCSVTIDRKHGNRDVWLFASAKGYASHSVRLPTNRHQVIRLELSRGTSLRGRVKLYDGRVPMGAVRVYAWTGVQDPSVGELSLTRKGVPRILSGMTDGAGNFEIGGVDAGEVYSVGAGAYGWTSKHIIPNVTADSPNLEVTLFRLYGCLLRAVDQEGRMCPESRLASVHFGRAPDKTLFVSHPSTMLRLAGIGEMPGVGNKFWDWRRWLFVCVAECEPEELGELRVTYTVPGFEKRIVLLTMPVVGRKIAEHKVVMREGAVGLGDVRLRMLSSLKFSDDMIEGVRKTPNRIEFRSLTGNVGEAYRVSMRNIGSGAVYIRSLPRGRYHVRLLAFDGMKVVYATNKLGLDPIVVSGEVCEVAIPVEHLGSVAISGAGKAVPAMIEAKTKIDGRMYTARFVCDSQPYLLQGLEEGAYELQISMSQGRGRERLKRTLEVEVEPGKLTKVEIQ